MSELAKKLVEVLGIQASEELAKLLAVAGVTVSGATTLDKEITGIIGLLPEKILQDWLNAPGRHPALVKAFELETTATLDFTVTVAKSCTVNYPKYDILVSTDDYSAANREREIKRTLFDIISHFLPQPPVKTSEIAEVTVKVK